MKQFVLFLTDCLTFQASVVFFYYFENKKALPICEMWPTKCRSKNDIFHFNSFTKCDF